MPQSFTVAHSSGINQINRAESQGLEAPAQVGEGRLEVQRQKDCLSRPAGALADIGLMGAISAAEEIEARLPWSPLPRFWPTQRVDSCRSYPVTCVPPLWGIQIHPEAPLTTASHHGLDELEASDAVINGCQVARRRRRLTAFGLREDVFGSVGVELRKRFEIPFGMTRWQTRRMHCGGATDTTACQTLRDTAERREPQIIRMLLIECEAGLVPNTRRRNAFSQPAAT